MAFESTYLTISVPVSQSFASLQFTFVQISATGNLIPPSGAGVFCDGVILDDNPNTGVAASSMAYTGVVKVVSAGTVNLGDLIATDSSGRAITAANAVHILGRALQGNGGTTGALIPVLLIHGGHASSGV